jgi:hypothetical protein
VEFAFERDQKLSAPWVDTFGAADLRLAPLYHCHITFMEHAGAAADKNTNVG